MMKEMPEVTYIKYFRVKSEGVIYICYGSVSYHGI